MRGDQLTRQWCILRQIEANKNGLTAAKIADECGVSLRTAYRDLNDLQYAGFPLYTEKGDFQGHGHRWKLMDTYRLKIPEPFTLTELLSLHLSQDLLSVFKHTVFHESIGTLFEKVSAALPPATHTYLKRIRSAFHMGKKAYKDYGRFREIIHQVNQAVIEERSIEIAYQGLKDESPVLRRINPYKIWFFEGSIYIIGLCHLRGEIRTFVLDRINMLRITDEKFAMPQNFDFEKFIRYSFKVMQDELHTVRIRISPSWAKYVGERTWHESQRIQKLFDGGIEISFKVAGFDEIKQWVMSMGPEAYVMEPEELKDMISHELRNTLAQYDDSVQPQQKIVMEENRADYVS